MRGRISALGVAGRARIAAAALAASVVAIAGCTDGPTEDGPRRNVVLIVLDTVAAQHMATYGYERVTTPEIDALAKRGLFFRNAYASAPWTLPSHASMFTGLLPIRHGAHQENLELDRRFTTVAEILEDEGYRTFAAVDSSVIGRHSGMAQGFDTYLEMYRRSRRTGTDGRHPTYVAVERFLDGLDEEDRFFVFLNYTEAHAPYRPPVELARRFLPEIRGGELPTPRCNWERYYLGACALTEAELSVLRGLYDAELAGLSRTIGELVELFERRDLLGDTIVFVTSDHGENLGDHGHRDHVFSLHDSLLRVPLIAFGDGLPRGEVRTDPTTSVDLFATILAAAGAPPPTPGPGRDLLDPSSTRVEAGPLLAEYYYPLQVLSVLVSRRRGYEQYFDRLAPNLRRLRSIREDGWKLIWGSDGRHELYHVARDPEERRDLAAREPERVRRLERRLFEHLSALEGEEIEPGELGERPEPKGFTGLDPETLESLRALGYVPDEP